MPPKFAFPPAGAAILLPLFQAHNPLANKRKLVIYFPSRIGAAFLILFRWGAIIKNQATDRLKIFWSWQSDHMGNISRHLVREALELAVASLTGT